MTDTMKAALDAVTVRLAERAAGSQRDLLKQHDAAVHRINAELAGLAEPEAA